MLKDLLQPDTLPLLIFKHLFHLSENWRVQVKFTIGAHVNHFEFVSVAPLSPDLHSKYHINVHISSEIVQLSFLLGSCFVNSNNHVLFVAGYDRTATLSSQSTNVVRNNVVLDRTKLFSRKPSLKCLSLSVFVNNFIVIISRIAKYRQKGLIIFETKTNFQIIAIIYLGDSCFQLCNCEIAFSGLQNFIFFRIEEGFYFIVFGELSVDTWVKSDIYVLSVVELIVKVMSNSQNEIRSNQCCSTFDLFAFIQRIVAQKRPDVIVKFIIFEICISDLIQGLTFNCILIKNLAFNLWMFLIQIFLIDELKLILAPLFFSSLLQLFQLIFGYLNYPLFPTLCRPCDLKQLLNL